jgi:hypothetical protein
MGHPDMVALLMERGASIAGVTKVGQTLKLYVQLIING